MTFPRPHRPTSHERPVCAPGPARIPSLLELLQIKAEARRTVIQRTGGQRCFDTTDQGTVGRVTSAQSFIRQVSTEFHRRLRLAGIHVEGA